MAYRVLRFSVVKDTFKVKKPRWLLPAGLDEVLMRNCLQSRDVAGLGALRTICNLEGHPLALVQSLESIALDGREVHKHIGTFRLLDEPESL